MKILRITYTRGDRATQPGGVILRQYDNGEYVAHHFNRKPRSTKPTEYFWGRYCSTEAKGIAAYESKLASVKHSIIPEADIAEEPLSYER